MDRDTGVALERTTLAWQRTALAVMAGGAVMCRLTVEQWGLGSVVPLVAGLAVGGWAFLEARGRYPRAAHRGGRAAALLATGTVLLALVQIAVVVSRA